MKRKKVQNWFFSFFRIISVILGIPRRKKIIPGKGRLYRDLKWEEVCFCSRECGNLTLLKGMYFTAPNSAKCVIVVQGYGRHLSNTEAGIPEIIKELVSCGYNVLLFDLRAHGESGGRKISLGYYETYDLLGARDFVVNRKKIYPQNIGLLGFSYGAMVSILAGAKEDFGALVLDSAPGSTFTYLKKTIKRLRMPAFLFNIMKAFANLFFGINADELDTEGAVKKISKPAMFICGRKDSPLFVSAAHLYKSKKRDYRDTIWNPDAFHTKAYSFYPKEYLDKLIEFLNKTL